MPQVRPSHPFFNHPTPLAMAHRGFSLDGLENSMAAFAAAVDLGYAYVETDVHATADGVVVAFHDPTLQRIAALPARPEGADRSAHGVVARLTWRQLQHARIGGREPIPTLEQLLGAWPHLRVNIDIKAAAAVAPLADVIERTASHARVCLASFSDRRRREVLRRLSAPVATSTGYWRTARFRAATATRLGALVDAALRGVDCVQVPPSYRRLPLLTAATVAAAHLAGAQVHAWTINDAPTMERLLDLGVDGIITDRADVLKDVLQRRGQWP
ncbi:MAG TPA: glycerophosphodiester phosphodiesterase family protein [Segeticoccus sp.]|uniref:glycerophosphodiester phosphodiesterase family protein n=1 Tax=Segeticoccus sp. TaxID=2706531 RepID=UPI002D7ED7ED|nr:glycerophosphodiester phosphodiesterase family protein [Segeticoccus sp.]HET8601410.1 glycerophosphodiester phosphodiesterase family protein [Segeticoccus sp.]